MHLNVGMQVIQSQAQRQVWRLGLLHWGQERLSRSTAALEGMQQALSCMASPSSCVPYVAELSADLQDCRRRAEHMPFASCLHVRYKFLCSPKSEVCNQAVFTLGSDEI